MKSVTIRLDDEQAERLDRLSGQLHNSEAGVVRFALDLLHKTISERQAVPVDTETEEQAA
jgi:predicted transcriptional regulator